MSTPARSSCQNFSGVSAPPGRRQPIPISATESADPEEDAGSRCALPAWPDTAPTDCPSVSKWRTTAAMVGKFQSKIACSEHPNHAPKAWARLTAITEVNPISAKGCSIPISSTATCSRSASQVAIQRAKTAPSPFSPSAFCTTAAGSAFRSPPSADCPSCMYWSRRSRLSSLPVRFLGSRSTIWIWLGTLNSASPWPQKKINSCASTAASAFKTTLACTCSPNTGSGTPKTAASATAGC